jgi:hypothetical protein
MLDRGNNYYPKKQKKCVWSTLQQLIEGKLIYLFPLPNNRVFSRRENTLFALLSINSYKIYCAKTLEIWVSFYFH